MITRTGYIVSCISYVVFMALDWLAALICFQFSLPASFSFCQPSSSESCGPIVPILQSPNSITNFQSLFHIFLLGFLFAIFAWTEGASFWRPARPGHSGRLCCTIPS